MNLDSKDPLANPFATLADCQASGSWAGRSACLQISGRNTTDFLLRPSLSLSIFCSSACYGSQCVLGQSFVDKYQEPLADGKQATVYMYPCGLVAASMCVRSRAPTRFPCADMPPVC